MPRLRNDFGYKIAKQKVKEQKIYNCKDYINSLLIKQLNCKLKMFDDDIENKYTKADKVIDCLWFKGRK